MNLVFTQAGRPILKQDLAKKDRLLVGRANDCDVSLFGDEISRYHCEFNKLDNVWIIKNISKSKITINGIPVENDSPIKIGDKINIGYFTIEVIKSPTKELDTKIIFGEPTKKIDVLNNNEEALMPNITLVIPPNPPHTFSLRDEVSIGKHPDCKITINDPYVSHWHASISSNGSSVIINDVGSSNGTFLDGHKISKAVLGSTGEFVIGKTKIKYKLERNNENTDDNDCPIIGNSPKIKMMIRELSQISPTDAAVCVMGESGTGKELVAKFLHEHSSRKSKPFIAVNCGAIPPSLIEGMFFGHEKGAFTGAIDASSGIFEQANGGTLFLDEVAELSLDMQTRLLRVLESKEVKRLGSKKDLKVDFRLIAATNKDLPRETTAGRFRNDLFHRIFVIPVKIPPLRERGKDVELIAKYYLKEFSPTGMHEFTKKALEKLGTYSWPGNVRELRNTIQRTLICSSDYKIDEKDVSIYKMCSTYNHDTNEDSVLKNSERKILEETLQKFNGNISKTAQELGIARSTLRSKLDKFNIK